MKKLLPLLLILFAIMGTYLYNTAPIDLEWKAYSKQAVQEPLLNNQFVIANFSSSYCHACKINEDTVYSTNEFKKFVIKNDIVILYADYFVGENAILLKKHGTDEIPLFVIYSPDGRTLVFDGEITMDNIEQLFDRAKNYRGIQ